jgi:hypothetical protein
MGIVNVTNKFKNKFNQFMHGTDYVQAYLDNTLMSSKNIYEFRLSKLDTVLQKLHVTNLKIDIKK